MKGLPHGSAAVTIGKICPNGLKMLLGAKVYAMAHGNLISAAVPTQNEIIKFEVNRPQFPRIEGFVLDKLGLHRR